MAAVLAAGGAIAAVAGCAPVQGSGSAAPSDVTHYQSAVSSSRAAEAAAAAKSACASWRSGYEVRRVATRAMVDYTHTPDANWDGIVPTLNGNVAAVTTESGKLPAVIATAQPSPNVHTLLIDYKTKLDAYGSALKADQAARGEGERSWVKAEPAERALLNAEDALEGACG